MKMKKRSGKILTGLSVCLAMLLLSGCLVPDNAYLMELNRNGKWMEAEKVGLQMLSNRNTFSHSQTCETYFHVIYAQTRLGKEVEARNLMGEYDSLIGREFPDPDLKWIQREMAELKDELGLLDETARNLLLSMEENGKGNYERARELALIVAEDTGSREEQKAVAYFVASVCSVRLKELKEAEIHFYKFEAFKAALPPGHQIRGEESFLRDGITELKGR